MKKLPLFAWVQKEQRYVRFPHHLLQTFADGSMGFHDPFPFGFNWHTAIIAQFSDHFVAHYTDNMAPDGYVLKCSIVTNDTKEQK